MAYNLIKTLRGSKTSWAGADYKNVNLAVHGRQGVPAVEIFLDLHFLAHPADARCLSERKKRWCVGAQRQERRQRCQLKSERVRVC